MKTVLLREEKVPPYWDVSKWTYLVDNFFVLCKRCSQTNRRHIEIVDLNIGKQIYKEQHFYNVILGSIDSRIIYFARVEDARTHLRIKHIGSFDIKSLKWTWKLDSNFYVEKFKIPHITANSIHEYQLGRFSVNLLDGTVQPVQPKTIQYWKVSSTALLKQENNILSYYQNEQKKWSLENYYGNWFHGIKNKMLYFLIPSSKQVALINCENGELIKTVDLCNVQLLKQRIGGSIDQVSLFDNTSIFDVLINDKYIVWLSINNNLLFYENSKINVVELNQKDNFLSNLNNYYLVLYTITEPEFIQIRVLQLEGD